MAVPPEEFVHYLQGRMADPSRTELLSFSYIWYQPLSKEIHDTWERMPSNLLGVPVFALLIWLHAPLWQYFAESDPLAGGRVAPPRRHRRASCGERGLSDDLCDGVRLFAMDLELGGLHVPDPACGEDLARLAAVPPMAADDRKTTILGWIVTLIPRVGIVRPFDAQLALA